jgi:hypothetical protein
LKAARLRRSATTARNKPRKGATAPSVSKPGTSPGFFVPGDPKAGTIRSSSSQGACSRSECASKLVAYGKHFSVSQASNQFSAGSGLPSRR